MNFNKKFFLVLPLFFLFTALQGQTENTKKVDPEEIGVPAQRVSKQKIPVTKRAINMNDPEENGIPMPISKGKKDTPIQASNASQEVDPEEVGTIIYQPLEKEQIEKEELDGAANDSQPKDADGDGKIDNPESVKTSTAKVSKTNVMKDEDKDQDGVIDKPASKKENN